MNETKCAVATPRLIMREQAETMVNALGRANELAEAIASKLFDGGCDQVTPEKQGQPQSVLECLDGSENALKRLLEKLDKINDRI